MKMQKCWSYSILFVQAPKCLTIQNTFQSSYYIDWYEISCSSSLPSHFGSLGERQWEHMGVTHFNCPKIDYYQYNQYLKRLWCCGSALAFKTILTGYDAVFQPCHSKNLTIHKYFSHNKAMMLLISPAILTILPSMNIIHNIRLWCCVSALPF